jgi:hypothetical protein
VPALNLAIANAGEILSGSADAHRNREALPDWLDKALGDQSDLPDIETSQLFALYMHCTYAEMEHRHAIKRSINKLVRRTLASTVVTDLNPELTAPTTRWTPALPHARHMLLSPFPFGNTNGIVDAFTVGLPGICKTGREVFERIDGAMFMRTYMPGWMVADTVEEYVEAAVRLANNHEERESLRSYMLEKNVVQRFFEGRPEVFGEMVLDLVNKQKAEHASVRTA